MRTRGETGLFRGCLIPLGLAGCIALVVLGVIKIPGADSIGDWLDFAGTDDSPRSQETTRGGAVTRQQILRRLGSADTVAERPDVAGYERDCGTGHACSFGPAWSDDTAAVWGRNGCDTRNDMLSHHLRRPEFEPGTNECVVTAGTLRDPYSGDMLEFEKSRAYEVGVDHVIPLALAWDLGADRWSLEERQLFANDPENLIVVSGSTNSSKSDRGPAEWMPPNTAYHCRYVLRFVSVLAKYDLPITTADRDAMRATAKTCPVARSK